jgi:hypothetical protein
MRRFHRALLFVAGLLTAVTAGADPRYKIERGPYEVRIVERLTLTDPVQGRDVDLRVLFPVTDGSTALPLVVYSTGAFCYPQMYDRITTHWVSHGYVVIEPNHLDSPNNDQKLQPSQYTLLLPSRARDISFVLDAADKISTGVSLPGSIDMTRAAAAGHSFGTVISMTKIGLHLKPEFQGPWGEPFDARIRAAVLMSGIGPGMEDMADNAFDGIRRPLLATGGTRDVGRVEIGELTPEEWRMQPFLLAPPGDKYSLITEGTDHYMGGLICNKDRGNSPDYEAVENVRSATTAFLDAYLRNDQAAKTYLDTVDMSAVTDGRARLRRR